MKTDPMCGNEVELFAQIWQRCLRVDSRDDTVNAEELGRAAEKRFVIGIEPETVVAKQAAEIQKITRAAAQIQDVEWPRPIKPEVLQALYVNANPIVCVLICIDLSRVRTVGIIFAQSHQFRLIDRVENTSRTYRVRPAASMLPQTFRRVAGKEFLKFLRRTHDETMQKRGTLLKERRLSPPSLLDFYANKTCGAFAGHESAGPAVARIKELFVTPKHLQIRT
jgi:hypothetical protein